MLVKRMALVKWTVSAGKYMDTVSVCGGDSVGELVKRMMSGCKLHL